MTSIRSIPPIVPPEAAPPRKTRCLLESQLVSRPLRQSIPMGNTIPTVAGPEHRHFCPRLDARSSRELLCAHSDATRARHPLGRRRTTRPIAWSRRGCWGPATRSPLVIHRRRARARTAGTVSGGRSLDDVQAAARSPSPSPGTRSARPAHRAGPESEEHTRHVENESRIISID